MMSCKMFLVVVVVLMGFCLADAVTEDVWWEDGGILEELGPRLSKKAKIRLRDDSGGKEIFPDLESRWQWWSAPHIRAVVEAQNEQDVAETILYATAHTIPFTPTSSHHGSTTTLSRLHNSIQISLSSISPLTINTQSTITIGPGTKNPTIQSTLWSLGKQTVTGTCTCVNLVVLALGGGHGVLQGYHGLLADQVVSARVVLANGSIVTASAHENEDLFWGLRGAGANLGVVTELEYMIYDIDDGSGGEEGENKRIWSYESFTYPATPENVKAVYGVANSQLEAQVPGTFQYGLVAKVGDEVFVVHHFVFHGRLEDTKIWTKGYHDLGPVEVLREEGTYLDIPRWIATHDDGAACSLQKVLPGAGAIRFPVDVEEYNLDALAEAVERFKEVVLSDERLAASFMMIEQYGKQAVRARLGDRTAGAFPSRGDRVLIAPAILYSAVSPSTGETLDPTLNDLAVQYGKEIRDILATGAEAQGKTSRSYINYAYGGETLEEIYGQEPWRLEKLKALKKEFDPHNRFAYYQPIPVGKEDSHSEYMN